MPPFEHVEILTLVLGAVVLGFALFERRRLLEVAGARLLLAAYGLLVASWTASVAESALLPVVLEWVQHLSAAVAAVLLVLWSVRFVASIRGPQA